MSLIFPAVFIGGPPHSGKSTLLYRLSHALRQAHVEHYALSASPDGEGDWTMEIAEPLVRELRLRAKDAWTAQFSARMSRDIDRRHLPLLVDIGGKVTPETEPIAAACTHALLIAPPDGDLTPWRMMLERLGRPLLAELRSDLYGTQRIEADGGVLRGTLTGLTRELSSDGPCWSALIAHLHRLFDYPADQLYHIHRTLTTAGLVLHLEHPIPPLPAHNTDQRWRPDELPTLLTSLPSDEPLAIYGRGPIWLYGALATFTHPAPQLFDPRQGWVTPPALQLADAPDATRLRWETVIQPDHTRVRLSIPHGYLDLDTANELPVPTVPIDRGVVLDGKLPNWLVAALVRSYRAAAWVAIYQPQLGDIVIGSHVPGVQVGEIRLAT